MNKVTMLSVIQPLLEREFDAVETMLNLKHNVNTYWSWGVSKVTNFLSNFQSKGLLMKVSGHHHKGYVLITLGWNDTYTVHIISNKGVIKDKYEDVYFDMLVEIIDNRIERIEEYQQ
jgi:predicted secreted Zn-dependent protease